MKRYLQDFDAMLDRELERLKNSGLGSDANLVLKYYHSMVSKDISVPRMGRTVAILRMARLAVQKPFSEASRDDWEDYFVV